MRKERVSLRFLQDQPGIKLFRQELGHARFAYTDWTLNHNISEHGLFPLVMGMVNGDGGSRN
jgi:hypothetical protein